MGSHLNVIFIPGIVYLAHSFRSRYLNTEYLPLGVSMSHYKRPLVLRPCLLWSYAPLRGSSKRKRVTNEISSGNIPFSITLQACAKQTPGTMLYLRPNVKGKSFHFRSGMGIYFCIDKVVYGWRRLFFFLNLHKAVISLKI